MKNRNSNNVFKLSGNLALGGSTNDYLRGNQNSTKTGSSNRIPQQKGRPSYEQNPMSSMNQNSRNYLQQNSYKPMGSYGNINSQKNVDTYQANKMQSGRNYTNTRNQYEKVGERRNPSRQIQQKNNRNGYERDEYTNSYNKPKQNSYNNPTQYQNTYNQASQYQNTYNQPAQYQNLIPQYNYVKKPSKPIPRSSQSSQIQQVLPPKRGTSKLIPKSQYKSKYDQQQSEPVYTKPTNYQPMNDQIKSKPYGQEVNQIREYDPSTFVMCRQGCGRKFNPDSVGKHQKICKKVFQGKRKQFNAQQQRIVVAQQKKLMKQGAVVDKKIQLKKKQQVRNKNDPKWKTQSEGLRALLQANRRGGQMTQQQKQLINKAQQATQIKCKFCGRCFNETSGPRHIAFCQSQMKKNQMKKKK